MNLIITYSHIHLKTHSLEFNVSTRLLAVLVGITLAAWGYKFTKKKILENAGG